MPLLNAIPFLKGAVQRSLPGGAPSTYIFHEGTMYARNAAVLASYPMPHILGTFAMAADDLEKALGRMPTEPQISSGDGTLILKAGRLKSEIQLLACEPPVHTGMTLGNMPDEAPPRGLLAALRLVSAFVPSDGTWNRSAKLEQNRILAISNRSAIEVQCEGLEVPEDNQLILTDDCIDYLTGLPSDPTVFCIERDAVWFSWANGAWIRCQLSVLPWPDGVFDQVLTSAGDVTPIQISNDWREAFADAVALGGDGYLTIRPTGICARSEQAEHLGEFETGVERETYWSMQSLKPVFGAGAQAWNPDAERIAAFTGPLFRGVVMAQRR